MRQGGGETAIQYLNLAIEAHFPSEKKLDFF